MPRNRLPHDIDPYDSELTATFERFKPGDGNGRAGKHTGTRGGNTASGASRQVGMQAANIKKLSGKGAVAKLAKMIYSRDMAGVQKVHQRLDAAAQQGAGVGRAADAKLDAWLTRRWRQRVVLAFDPIWQAPVFEGVSVSRAKAAAHLWLAVEMGWTHRHNALAASAAAGKPVELHQVPPPIRLCSRELDVETCRQIIHNCIIKRGFGEETADRMACDLATDLPTEAGPGCKAPASMIEAKQDGAGQRLKAA